MSDIDTAVVVSLKVLDPDGRLEKRTKSVCPLCAMSRQRTPEVTASLAVTLALHIVHVRPRIWDEAICVRHPHLRECLCVEDSLLR